jgi:hypothetical protein
LDGGTSIRIGTPAGIEELFDGPAGCGLRAGSDVERQDIGEAKAWD